MKSTNSKDALKLDIFSSLSEADVKEIYAASRIKNYKKGQIIFSVGDAAINFYIIIKGWVKIFRETEDGQEAVLAVLNNQDFFGENSVLGNNSYPSNAETVDSTEILEIPGKVLQDKIKKYPNFALKVMSALSNKLNKVDMELEHMAVMSAPQRLGCFLLRIADRDTGIIDLPFEKSLIAARLGMRPETFSRALSNLKDGLVEIKGERIIIHDIFKLEAFACASCSSIPEQCLEEKDKTGSLI